MHEIWMTISSIMPSVLLVFQIPGAYLANLVEDGHPYKTLIIPTQRKLALSAGRP